jgi:hypothetical protein
MLAGLVIVGAMSASCASILGFEDGMLVTDGGGGGTGSEGGPNAADATGGDPGSDAALDGATAADAPSSGDAADAADAADATVEAAVDAGPKQAFETPLTFNGRLDANGIAGAGGVAAGDARCQEAALATFPGRTFVAWLSTGSASAASRLAGGGPWYVGANILGGLAELTTGTLKTLLDKAPNGAAIASPLGVWTGTNGNGTANGARCIEWSSIASADAAEIGTSGAIGISWTYATMRSCNSTYHLYCFEK